MDLNKLTPMQRDTLDALALRLHVASLAVNALGATPTHDAAVLDVASELEAFTAAGVARPRRVVARRRIG